MKNTSQIPAPPDRPRYHDYAAGAVGDRRPLEERFAERVALEEGLIEKFGALTPSMRKALERAFRAGRSSGLDDAGNGADAYKAGLRAEAARRLAIDIAQHRGGIARETRMLAGFVLAEDPESTSSVRQALAEAIAARGENLHDGFEPGS